MGFMHTLQVFALLKRSVIIMLFPTFKALKWCYPDRDKVPAQDNSNVTGLLGLLYPGIPLCQEASFRELCRGTNVLGFERQGRIRCFQQDTKELLLCSMPSEKIDPSPKLDYVIVKEQGTFWDAWETV